MNFGKINHASKIIILSIICLLAIPVCVLGQLPRLILNEVYVDFAIGEDNPLIKTKFNVYDPVGPTMEQFDQNVKIMNELNIETYRIELAWGRRRSGFGLNRMIDGTADLITYDFGPLDHMVTELKKQNVLLHGAYCYCPFPLQDPNVGRFRDSRAPNDIEKWKEIVATVATHYLEMGIPFGVDEIWNEADGLYVFYSGTEEEFQQVYKAAVEGILAVNPDATIAGPASAPELMWHRSFPEFVAKEKLPMDAFTFHHYGSGELALNSIDKVANSLNRFPHFNTTSMVMDEWHSADLIEPWCRDDDVRDTYEGASQLLHDFNILLSRPELTSVSWAWYMDPARARATCMGLISNSGHRKAVFNAWKIYGKMPVDRKKVKVIGPFETMASADEHNIGVVIWNPDPYRRRIDVHLDNIPFAKGDVRVYRIDRSNASWGDGAEENLIPVETFTDVDLTTWEWLDHIIPEHGIIYIEADDDTGLSELTPVEVANVIKVNHYYPQRGTSSYADFDRKTWIARLGMAKEKIANQQVGVLANGLPDTLRATVTVEEKLQNQDQNSLLGIRVDYNVQGTYSKSVLFHGPYNGVDLYNSRRNAKMPWGTKKQADEVIRVNDLAEFQIALKKLAPENWKGKAHITFIMQNAGQGTRAKIILRPLQ
jgi:xylan 1,4-beta-xylosidase